MNFVKRPLSYPPSIALFYGVRLNPEEISNQALTLLLHQPRLEYNIIARYFLSV